MIVNVTLSVDSDPVDTRIAAAVDSAATAAPEHTSLPNFTVGLELPSIPPPQLRLETGKTIFVTGPNGVGKSSLLAEIDRELIRHGAQVETFFGNRHIQFQSDDIDQVGQSLEQLQAALRSGVTRFRHPWGEQHLKSVLRRVSNLQAQAAYDVIQAQENGASLEEAMTAHPQVMRTINGIFEAARLPIRITLTAGGLRARRDETEYGINRLSDGERAALLLVGAVLIQPSDSFILVDEPERHLNPAISGALLAALIRTRKDIGFVFASHDLQLLEWLHPEQIIHVRDSFVIRSDPEDRRYAMTLLTEHDSLPEELRSAVLGSRRMLLLVEGNASSEDKALYGHIYRDWNIVARDGCDTVVNGVKALRVNRNYHWAHVAGIIDRDGRDASEKSSLAADRIFCLPVPTIENLFVQPVVLEQMASAMHQLKGGLTGAERIARLKVELPEILQICKEDIILKRLVWAANRRNSNNKVSVQSVRRGQNEIAQINLIEIKESLEAEFDVAVSDADPIMFLSQIPIKESVIPARVAKILGFENFKEYMRSVLQQIEINSRAGKAILESLRAVMPELPVTNAGSPSTSHIGLRERRSLSQLV